LGRERLICAGAVKFCVRLKLIAVANEESQVLLAVLANLVGWNGAYETLNIVLEGIWDVWALKSIENIVA